MELLDTLGCVYYQDDSIKWASQKNAISLFIICIYINQPLAHWTMVQSRYTHLVAKVSSDDLNSRFLTYFAHMFNQIDPNNVFHDKIHKFDEYLWVSSWDLLSMLPVFINLHALNFMNYILIWPDEMGFIKTWVKNDFLNKKSVHLVFHRI